MLGNLVPPIMTDESLIYLGLKKSKEERVLDLEKFMTISDQNKYLCSIISIGSPKFEKGKLVSVMGSSKSIDRHYAFVDELLEKYGI